VLVGAARRALVAATLVLAMAPAGAGADDARAGDGQASDGRPREGQIGGGSDLVLITVDTLRADALSVNRPQGGGAPTPHLDALAAAGANFTRAATVAPLTLPAHASILTGRYPPVHGVRDNGQRLPEGAVTLAEVLAGRGYRTGAFVGSFVLDRRFGLAQGFATYDDRVAPDLASIESLAAERPADAVLGVFEGWLRESAGNAPLFAWIHLYDPHAPYAPPEPFATRWAGEPYAGEVAYVDQVVGGVLEALDERGRRDRAVIALVGDHGEGLGEHGESTHSLLIYNSTLRVPMILVAPGRIAAGTRVTALVRTIDLGATLLDYLGFEPELGEGRSLQPLIEKGGTSTAAEKGGTSEGSTSAGSSAAAYGESLYGELHLGWSALRSLETERYRLIEAPRPELYDVAGDPGETTDLAASRPDLLRSLRAELARLEAALPEAGEPAPAALDAATAARLEALGYLSGDGSRARTEVDDTPPVDPKDAIGTWEEIQRAIGLYGGGRYEEAAVRFADLLSRHERTPLLYEYLGASYLELERFEDAAGVYRRALDRGIDGARLRTDLARAQEGLGATTEAERNLAIALELEPSSVDALYRLADLRRREGRPAEAVTLFERAVEINPDHVWAWNGLGRARAEAGRDAEALAAFRRAAAIAPDEIEPLYNLAVQLDRMGRVEEAAANYRSVVDRVAGRPGWERERELARRALERLGDSSSERPTERSDENGSPENQSPASGGPEKEACSPSSRPEPPQPSLSSRPEPPQPSLSSRPERPQAAEWRDPSEDPEPSTGAPGR
jgi:arylsulfatase A-like enzyme